MFERIIKERKTRTDIPFIEKGHVVYKPTLTEWLEKEIMDLNKLDSSKLMTQTMRGRLHQTNLIYNKIKSGEFRGL